MSEDGMIDHEAIEARLAAIDRDALSWPTWDWLLETAAALLAENRRLREVIEAHHYRVAANPTWEQRTSDGPYCHCDHRAEVCPFLAALHPEEPSDGR